MDKRQVAAGIVFIQARLTRPAPSFDQPVVATVDPRQAARHPPRRVLDGFPQTVAPAIQRVFNTPPQPVCHRHQTTHPIVFVALLCPVRPRELYQSARNRRLNGRGIVGLQQLHGMAERHPFGLHGPVDN